MSVLRTPKPAKLIISLFMNEKLLFGEVADTLAKRFGCFDVVSQWMAFDYTDYYTPEMGTPLFRRMLAFQNLIAQDALAEFKIFTNEVESKYAINSCRKINIDPGYMTCERFVLASGKNFTHRISIGRNVFADLTLIYQKGAFQRLPWTYPDYADHQMLAYLQSVRGKYMLDIKRE